MSSGMRAASRRRPTAFAPPFLRPWISPFVYMIKKPFSNDGRHSFHPDGSLPSLNSYSPPNATSESIPAGAKSDTIRQKGYYLINDILPFRPERWPAPLCSTWTQLRSKAALGLEKLGSSVNDVSGYKEVEILKSIVLSKEEALTGLREDARTAKVACDAAISARSTTQRDVNALLERKHSWTEEDVSRFTSLVRSDHAWSSAVTATSARLAQAELSVDRAFTELTQAILTRYHEEQVWSDKIRSVSTYANLAGLLVNLAVFIGAFAIVEPWKRRRLIERLEERVAGMMNNVGAVVEDLARKLDGFEGQRITPAIGIEAIRQSASLTSPMLSFGILSALSDIANSHRIRSRIDELKSSILKQDVGVLGAVAATLTYGFVTLVLSWIAYAFC